MKRTQGFTLLELTIAMVIFSIILAISIPPFYTISKSSYQKDVTRLLLVALRHARTQAVTENVEYQVAFDLDSQTYWLERGNLSNNSTRWDIVRVYDPIKQGIVLRALAQCTSTTGERRIQFNPNGTSNALYICVINPTSLIRYRAGTSVAKIGRPIIQRDATGTGKWK